MKFFTLIASAALFFTTEASEVATGSAVEEARFLMRCANAAFQCPASSRPRRRRGRCPSSFSDCVCEDGFEAVNDQCVKTFTLDFTNAAYAQPMSPFLVIVHSKEAMPLYQMGEAASDGLAALAEGGATSMLESMYTDAEGVFSVQVFGGITMPGATTTATIHVNNDYKYVSVASMLVNTNDAFAGWNGVDIFSVKNSKVSSPALDAGSEMNNESCDSIPGPACPDSGNERSLGGEGFVHVHRGIHGVGDLTAASADWRNPVLVTKVSYSGDDDDMEE